MLLKNQSELAKNWFRPRLVQSLKKTAVSVLFSPGPVFFGFRECLDWTLSQSYFLGPKNQTGLDFQALVIHAKYISSVSHTYPKLAKRVFSEYSQNRLGNVMGWCYGWLQVQVWYLSHTWPHNTLGMVFSYHHLHHPSSILLPTAANCPCTPLLSPEGCGLACSYSLEGYGRKSTRGDPVSGRLSWCVMRTGHDSGPVLTHASFLDPN